MTPKCHFIGFTFALIKLSNIRKTLAAYYSNWYECLSIILVMLTKGWCLLTFVLLCIRMVIFLQRVNACVYEPCTKLNSSDVIYCRSTIDILLLQKCFFLLLCVFIFLMGLSVTGVNESHFSVNVLSCFYSMVSFFHVQLFTFLCSCIYGTLV